MRRICAVLALAIVAATGSTVLPRQVQAEAPTLPQRDGFYDPPKGWATENPGTVLRSRRVELAAFGAFPLDVAAWQLLYRTTSAQGRPTTTVTTVIRPSSGRVHGLVSYQIAEDASGPQCAPSHVLRRGGGEPVGSLMSQIEILMIAAALSRGHAVSVPDWEGRPGALFAPKQAGYLALDGVRAAERFDRLGLRGTRTPVVAWGYSGGGFATGWTAQLQPRYAPEVKLRGAAVGAPITTVRKTFSAINGGLFSGFYPSILPGMLRANPALREAFHRHLTPVGRGLIEDGDQHCLATHLVLHAALDMDDYLDIPFRTLMGQPKVRRAFKKMNPGGRPRAPLLVYQAVHDELVFASDTAGTVGRWCRNGARVHYLRDQLSEHASLMITGGPVALGWLERRLRGRSVANGCRTTTVPSTTLTGPGLTALPGYLLADLGALLGLPPEQLGVV